jgi:hypothetical protein
MSDARAALAARGDRVTITDDLEGKENRDVHEDSVSNTGRIQRLVVEEITFV